MPKLSSRLTIRICAAIWLMGLIFFYVWKLPTPTMGSGLLARRSATCVVLAPVLQPTYTGNQQLVGHYRWQASFPDVRRAVSKEMRSQGATLINEDDNLIAWESARGMLQLENGAIELPDGDFGRMRMKPGTEGSFVTVFVSEWQVSSLITKIRNFGR